MVLDVKKIVNTDYFPFVASFGLLTNKNTLEISGKLGCVQKQFTGFDVNFFYSKIFCRSQGSMLILNNKLRSIILGISKGYFVEIALVGLGYQFMRFGKVILLKVGFSHYIRLEIPSSVHIVGFRKKFIIYGIDLDEVQKLTRLIESFKKPDLYKGKGIVIQNKSKKLVLKVGKQK